MIHLHSNFSNIGVEGLKDRTVDPKLVTDPVNFMFEKTVDSIVTISTNYQVFEDFVNSEHQKPVKLINKDTKSAKLNSASKVNKEEKTVSRFKNFFKPGVDSICDKIGVNNIKTFGLALASSAVVVSLAVAFPIPSAAIAAVTAIKGRNVLRDLNNFNESLDKTSIMSNINKLKDEYLSISRSNEHENIFRNA